MAIVGAAAPAAAEDGWHSYSTPQNIGSFEAPCEPDTVEAKTTATYDRWMCTSGGLNYVSGVVPISQLARDDFTDEQAANYTFAELEADAEADPETTGFLAVEYGGFPAFYAASAPDLLVQRILIMDLGNGRVLMMLAASDDVIEGTGAAQALGESAEQFLISFKVTPQ
ncbi:hypothetical protein [Citromicrobium bathyomarinum]|uniref:hypothetical protein n=1 Tax=Citromicrobium bathyomarinum TaxID=72174 RepID=UPI00315B3F21